MCLADFNWKMGCCLSESLSSSALSRAADPKRASSTAPKRFARVGLGCLSTSTTVEMAGIEIACFKGLVKEFRAMCNGLWDVLEAFRVV